MRIRVKRLGLVMAACTVSIATAALPAMGDASHAQINGSGSSWSANAVNQWITDVYSSNRLSVVFTGSGSATGRKDFSLKTTDFAVTDIGFQGRDPVTGDSDDSGGRPYAYLPIVAGGTSFPYHVERAGQLVRNLRLSGQTLAKIFTNQITDWSDPQLTKDNNGQALPALPIIPVVHSEGSGSTAQFTTYLAKQYGSIWGPFNDGRNTLTEYYPRKGAAVSQNGSDGVMNYVASAAANGAIGFDEFSYALGKNYPVAKIENVNGFYTLPSQYNVAVGLTKAQINQDKSSPNYLLQDLSDVYVNPDPRTYPLSSYSYAIIPTGSKDQEQSVTTAKRQTMADYLYYSLCTGQKEMGPIGYSPLPVNLVQAAFDQVGKLKTADPGVDVASRDVTTCNNPTFIAGQPSRNYLAEIAPQPPPCDKDGAGPCAGSGDAGTANPVKNGAGQAVGSSASAAGKVGIAGKPTTGAPGSTKSGTSGAKAGGSANGAGSAAGGSGVAGASQAGASAGTSAARATGAASGTVDPSTGAVTGTAAIDPATGAVTGTAVLDPASAAVGDAAGGAVAGTEGTASLTNRSTALAANPSSSMNGVLGPLAVLELLALVLVPPLLAAHLRRRPQASGGRR